MKHTLYSLVISLLVIFPVMGQQIYSLDDCIRIGLERNYDIRIVRNEQQISENNATIGNAGYLPTVKMDGGFSGTVNNHKNKLKDGTTEKKNGINGESANVGLNVNWTIFDGFGIQATYQKLQELRKMGELNTRITIEDFIADLSSEYYNLIRQKIRLKNLHSALALSKERLRIVEAQKYTGSMSRLDLLQAQVDFNADSSKMINQLETVHASRIRLNQLMALEDVETKIQIKDSLITPNPFLDEVGLWESALASNSLLLKSQKNIHLSQLDLKKLKSRNYPYVRLNAGYGYTANWNEVGPNDLQQRLGANYGVTVGIPIFDGMNRRREQRNARIKIENQELATQDLELSLRADLSKLWMAYRNNLELWALEKENLKAAQENYQIAIDRYKLGNLSGIELREAQNSLLAAEERQSITEYSTKICEISLVQLSGQIISYFEREEKEE